MNDQLNWDSLNLIRAIGVLPVEVCSIPRPPPTMLLVVTTPLIDIAFIIQSSAKNRALGCVNAKPAARGSQEAEFTQPWSHSFAQLCASGSSR